MADLVFPILGEYPTCGTTSSEAADENAEVRRRRGVLSAVATDFAIDLGFVIAGVVVLIVLAAYNYQKNDGLWRVCFGLGLVLPVGLLFVRLRLVNSTQYRKHAMKKEIPYLLVIKRYWKPMLGTSLAWFVYDFVVRLPSPSDFSFGSYDADQFQTYPFGLYGSTILATLNPKNTLVQTVGYGTVLNCFYLPGALLGGFLMDKIGRKQTMTLGFVLWSIMAFIIGGAINPLKTVFPLFVVLYGIFNAVAEMGPGVS